MSSFVAKTTAKFFLISVIFSFAVWFITTSKGAKFDTDIVLISIYVWTLVGLISSFDTKFDARAEDRPIYRTLLGALLFSVPYIFVFASNLTVVPILAGIGAAIGYFGYSFFKHLS